MSFLPKTIDYDLPGIERLEKIEDVQRWLRMFVRQHQLMYERLYDRITHLDAQDHIVDADGNLADITTKFNTLLSQLESQKLLNTS